VRGAQSGSAKTRPFRIVPESGKSAEHVSQSTCPQSWRVFRDDPGRPQLSDDSEQLGPEPAGIALSPPEAGEGNGLARRSSAKNVNRSSCIMAHLTHVFESLHSGPVARQHAATVGVRLGLPDDGAQPRAFEAEVEGADPAK
jgi:hypothetical protein